MLYRIYIPALSPEGVSMTIDVEARNWMLALRYGLDEVGADRDIVKRAICDIKADKTIHVMEPAQGRVFVLRELPNTAEAAALTPDRVDTHQMQRLPTSKLRRPRTEDIPWHEPGDDSTEAPGRDQLADVVTQELPQLSEEEIEASRRSPGDYPLDESDLEKYFEPPANRPKRTISHLDLDGHRQDTPQVVSREPSAVGGSSLRADLAALEKDSEDLFARVFEEMAEIDFVGSAIEDALQYSLELAVKRIPSEAGWLLLADMNRRDLYVATATGPRAEEVIKYRLPMGRGIAGFCAVNGVSLTLSEVEQDPRFQLLLSRAVGLDVRSVACSPIQHDGRVFGALQVLNHERNPEYTPGELDVLNYIARRTAEFLATHVRL